MIKINEEEEIIGLIHKGFDLELISFELDIPIEQLHHLTDHNIYLANCYNEYSPHLLPPDVHSRRFLFLFGQSILLITHPPPVSRRRFAFCCAFLPGKRFSRHPSEEGLPALWSPDFPHGKNFPRGRRRQFPPYYTCVSGKCE